MKFNIKNKIGNFLLDSFLYSFLSTNGNLQRIILKVISKGLICFSFAPRQHLLTLVRVWLYMIVKIRKLFAFFPSALFNWSISSKSTENKGYNWKYVGNPYRVYIKHAHARAHTHLFLLEQLTLGIPRAESGPSGGSFRADRFQIP